MAAEVADSPDKLIGEVLASRYQIEHRLGEGAMGTVFRARHVKVGRPFAVKVLHPHLLLDKKVQARFEREAELAGRLRHANVIGVVDVGETTDGMRYMVMDFAAGPDLATLLGEAPMKPERIIHLVRQMLEGLYHAHQEGLIHRDFKPENVIIEKDSHGAEVPRIVDFGIAILREGGDSTDGPGRLTTNGLVLGTPHYMAPEQAVADPIDHRIDLFALGIMIYEMLSGKLPFDGSGAEVARANLLLDPPPISQRVPYLEVDPLLEAFARRLLAKKRDLRPPTAKAARELLDLIDRDREAAAAALGVPAASARVGRETQPVAPRAVDHRSNATFPPPIRGPIGEAPTLASPVAVAEGPPQASITTDPVDPLPVRKKQRWPLLVLALGGVTAVAVVGMIALGGNDDKPKESPPVAIADKPAPVVEQPPPPPPVVVDAATPEPAVAGSDEHPVEHPIDRPKPPHPITRPAHPGTHGPAHDPPQVAVTHEPAHDPPQVAVTHEPAHAEQPPAVPPPPEVNDQKAFTALYTRVGAELKAYEDKHGRGSAGDLQARYSMIRFSIAVATQQSRDDAAASLTKIRAGLAALK